MNIYFIGGASGSGKTSVIPYLSKLTGDAFSIYDFDEIGVPSGADKAWRQESTEKWLKKLIHEQKDACLIGQIVLGEILSCPSSKNLGKINFCLLDVEDFERVKRLKKRSPTEGDQNTLNWSSWLRMHCHDPHWMTHVIRENHANILDFHWLNDIDKWGKAANIHVIDSTKLTLQETSEKIFLWIKNCENSIEYVPGGKYRIYLNQKNSFEVVDQKLFEFNKKCVPPKQTPEVINLNFTIMDEDRIIAGICADIYIWKILFISVLFVEENYRSKGLGTYLIERVEREGRKIGATLAHLDTFEWQAYNFYLKKGYEVFGILEDCPKGFKRYYMKKIL